MPRVTWVLVAGATEQEAIENIRDAIQEYLAAIAESLKDADVREIEVSI